MARQASTSPYLAQSISSDDASSKSASSDASWSNASKSSCVHSSGGSGVICFGFVDFLLLVFFRLGLLLPPPRLLEAFDDVVLDMVWLCFVRESEYLQLCTTTSSSWKVVGMVGMLGWKLDGGGFERTDDQTFR